MAEQPNMAAETITIDPITLERIYAIEAPGVTYLGFRVVK